MSDQPTYDDIEQAKAIVFAMNVDLRRKLALLEHENAELRELVGSVPREVFLDNGETSQRALANYEAFNAARKEAKP